ncbi:ABC transporter ATP-binding protein [Exiguobacterium acetylicum]|uniref:ATP-binding cassette domain-containing protein n=1 Tax=Exiguobacterium acetylicum TaxID=41170 RepID=UPI0018D066F7|nr:ABC transporter ATP-binding protein [Exiguobacterium acetylicum]
MIIEMKYGKVRFDLNVGLSENSRKLHYLENLLVNKSTLKEIRLGQKENYILKNWIKSFKVNAVSQMKIEKKQMYLQSVVQIIISLSFVFSISLVIYLVSNSLLKLAALTAVIQAVQNLQGIVPSFANNLANSYEATLSVDEFQKFQNQLGKTDNIKKLDIEKLEVLTVKNLNYYYPNSHHKALNNINLSISKSKKIAIMGNNGSGKSTLVKCMTGLYESKNSVLLNNEYLIEDVNLESLWNEVNVMFQDFNKYEMTMAENISMDNLNINNEKLESLLELVGLKDLFDQFPNKSNTQLGNLFNKGKELSGGQWQKIALARAIYNQKSFLFLDEPTSALDPDSEYQVIESILKKLNEVGIIYITHRVNVAKLADIIIYMKNGEITEQGTHEELIKKGGDYSEVFERQIGSLIEHKEGVINA